MPLHLPPELTGPDAEALAERLVEAREGAEAGLEGDRGDACLLLAFVAEDGTRSWCAGRDPGRRAVHRQRQGGPDPESRRRQSDD